MKGKVEAVQTLGSGDAYLSIKGPGVFVLVRMDKNERPKVGRTVVIEESES